MRRHKLCLIFSLLFCSSTVSVGQTMELTNETLISNLNALRNDVIVESEENVAFREVLEKWHAQEPNVDNLLFFIFNAVYSVSVRDYDFDFIKKAAKKITKNSLLSESFTEKELNTLTRKNTFLLLLEAQIFDVEFPFQIKENQIFEELRFFDIQENDIVADIGAGQGPFSLLIYLSQPKIKLYINEIKEDLLRYMKRNIVKYINKKDKSICKLIKGDKKNTNLPEKVDKIILRNAFHHFSKKKQMMKSIKSALKQDGLLLISETLKTKDSQDCDKRMDEKKLKSEFKKYGFILVEELQLGTELHMKYKLDEWDKNKSR